MLERVAAEMRLGHFRQQAGVERARARPGEPGPFAFALEHGEIEAERVPDQDRAGHGGGEFRPDGGKTRRRGHHRIVDLMDAVAAGGIGSPGCTSRRSADSRRACRP